VTPQKLPELIARTLLIRLGCLAQTHQVAQRFVRLVRHPHRGQFTRPQIARQLDRIPTIRLDSIPGLDRNQRRSHYDAINTQPRQLTLSLFRFSVQDRKPAARPHWADARMHHGIRVRVTLPEKN
jgi:hypothetical protein